eukprot:5911205-Pyramimonas_sp.AAC.1
MWNAKLEPVISYSAGIRASETGERREGHLAVLCGKLEEQMEPQVATTTLEAEPARRASNGS